MEFSRRIDALKPLLIKEIAGRVGAAISNGHRIVNLSQGVPCLDIFDEAAEAMQEIVATKDLPYTNVPGLESVRTSAAAFVSKFYKIPVGADHVLITSGGIQACFVTLGLTIESEKDVVLTSLPAYGLYLQQCRCFGGFFATVATKKTDGYALTATGIEASFINQKAEGRRIRAVVLCTPNNPTGSCFEEAEARRIAAFLESQLEAGEDFVVLCDEVYIGIEKLAHVSIMQVASPALLERCCLVLSCSKGLGAMPGARAAWVTCLNTDLVAKMAKLQTVTSGNASIISQAGLRASLDLIVRDDSVLKGVRDYYRERTSIMFSGLNLLGQKYDLGSLCTEPSGGFYLWVDFSGLGSKLVSHPTVSDDVALCEYFLNLYKEEGGVGVACIPGSAFSMDTQDWLVRINCARKDVAELSVSLTALDSAIAALLAYTI